MMHAWLIDAHRNEILRVEATGDDWGAAFDDDDANVVLLSINVDGSMLVVNRDQWDTPDLTTQRFFTVAGCPHAVPGRGVIVGYNMRGRRQAPTIGYDDLCERVQFLSAHDILALVCNIER